MNTPFDDPEHEEDAPQDAPEAFPRITETRFYRSSPVLQRTFLAFLGPLVIGPWFVLLYGLIASHGHAVEAGAFTGVLFGVIFVPLFWFTVWRYPRLLLTETSIEVQQLGYRLMTRWDNVASLRKEGTLALVTREPMTGSSVERFAAFSDKPYEAVLDEDDYRALTAQHRYLPLVPFQHWFKKGDLAAELTKRAPWLAPDIAAPSVKHRPFLQQLLFGDQGRPRPRKNLVVFLAVILLLVGLAIVQPPHADDAIAVVMAACFVGYAIINLISAVRFLRASRYFLGTFSGAFSLVMFLLGVVIIGSVLPD